MNLTSVSDMYNHNLIHYGYHPIRKPNLITWSEGYGEIETLENTSIRYHHTHRLYSAATITCPLVILTISGDKRFGNLNKRLEFAALLGVGLHRLSTLNRIESSNEYYNTRIEIVDNRNYYYTCRTHRAFTRELNELDGL